jgi:hypothetical protein
VLTVYLALILGGKVTRAGLGNGAQGGTMKGIGWRAAAAAVVLAVGITATAVASVHGTTHKVPGTLALQAVGCPSQGSCIAVGEGPVNKQNRSKGVYVAISGGKPGTAHLVAGTQALLHVACPKANYCIAVGDVFSGTTNKAEYVVINHGQAGAVRQLGIQGAASIGCGSSSSCWVPGADCSANGSTCTNRVVHLVDGTVEKVYSEQGTYSFYAGEGGGATPACSSATSCILAGTAKPGTGPGLLFSLNDGKVKVTHRVSAVTAISGLDCTSKTYCTILGYKTSGTGRTATEHSEVLTLSSGKLGTAHAVDGVNLFPLACRAADACFAFGFKRVKPYGPVVVPIDRGKPGSPQKIQPSILGATCTSKSCLGVGSEGQHPNQAGAVFSF